MKNDLVEFVVIQNGIKGLRARAENGIKRITADFLVSNFFEDIEVLRKRGFNFEEIIDELHILLADTIPEKDCNVLPSPIERNSSHPAILRVAFWNIPLNTPAQKSL